MPANKGGGKRDDSYFAADRRKKKKYMMIIIPVIIAVAAAGAAGALLYKPQPVLAINGIECHGAESTTYHVHSHLDVFVDGQRQEIPAQVGILSSPYCLFWLHTHSADGVIHVESPTKRQFTLGQFLDIWNQTHSGSQTLFGAVSGKPVTAYVNGTQFQGDYRSIPLESRQEITIAYGKPPSEIPKGWDDSWPAS
jgi:hypothetical protein